MRTIYSTLIILLLSVSVAFARDPLAKQIATDTTAFNNNLSTADDTVQKALETLDELISSGGAEINWDDPAAIAALGWTRATGKVYLATATDNVGIGSSAPTAKLYVGTASAPNAMPITGYDLYVKGNIEVDGKLYGDGSQLSNLPAGMVYPGAGIALAGSGAWGTSITDNSTNWNTAYTDRLKWDGGATGLVAATGRTSLGLGTAAQSATGDFLAAGGTAVNASAVEGTDLGTLTNAKVCTYDSAGTEIDCDTTMTVDTNTTYTASGTLLNLSTTTFSVNAGTLTNGKLCTYVTGTGLVCNNDVVTDTPAPPANC